MGTLSRWEKMGSFRQHFDIQPLAHSILVENTGSCFRPLSREADSLEGLNVHGGIIDELHAHRTRDVFDVVDEATGSRRQPLLFIISTEGEHSVGAFAEQVAYGQNVLRGNHVDQSYFCVYYAIDKDDDWTNEAAWYKANPNLGVSVFIEDMRLRCKQALVNSQSQSSFLMKRLNVRVGAYSTYFNLMSWHSLCKDEKIKMEDFKGQPCIITIDLASKRGPAPRGSSAGVLLYAARHYLPELRIRPPSTRCKNGDGETDSNHLDTQLRVPSEFEKLVSKCVLRGELNHYALAVHLACFHWGSCRIPPGPVLRHEGTSARLLPVYPCGGDRFSGY